MHTTLATSPFIFLDQPLECHQKQQSLAWVNSMQVRYNFIQALEEKVPLCITYYSQPHTHGFSPALCMVSTK